MRVPTRVAFPDVSQIIRQSESGNRDYASGNVPMESPKGAKYAMQVMPATARDPGFGIRPARNDSPEEYNRVGEEYWRKMLDRYQGDYRKMWGAYNWGPGNLDAAVKRYGDRWLDYAPAETRNYVTRNMRALGR